MTTRRGYTQSRLYRLSGTNQVYNDLRGLTIQVMSPRTRTSFTTIRLALDSWAIPRMTLGSPLLTHLHHPPADLGGCPSSPTPDLEDPMLALTDRFDAFWDETQEHRVLLAQDMEALHADMRTFLANQATILQQQQSLQAQLAQLLAHHQPPPPPPQ